MNAKIKSDKIKNRIVELVIRHDMFVDDLSFHKVQLARLATEVKHHKHAAKLCEDTMRDLSFKIDEYQKQIKLNKTP